MARFLVDRWPKLLCLAAFLAVIVAGFVALAGPGIFGWVRRFDGLNYEYDGTARLVNPFAVLNHPEHMVYRLLERHHAFPEGDAVLSMDALGPSLYDPVPLAPVSSYHVGKVTIGSERPFLESLGDDAPTYGARTELCVSYRDGSQRLFEVSVWSYGHFLGFFSPAVLVGESWIRGGVDLVDKDGCP